MNAAGTVTAYNTWGPTGLLARTRPGAHEETWYQFDLQGDMALRLAADGRVLSTDRYDAWGNAQPGSNAADPYGYKAQAGYYRDAETGLYLCTWRYYDPQAGRWLTADPIGYAGGLNVYAYSGNDPWGMVDALGLCANGGRDADWVDHVTAFFAGWGDTLSFSLTGVARQALGVDEYVNKDSVAYKAGIVTGMAHGVAMAKLGGAKGALPRFTGAGGSGAIAKISLSSEVRLGLGKLAGKLIRPSAKGITIMKKHLKSLEALDSDTMENVRMVERIESALAEGRALTGADASFYMHEIAEATLMSRGIAYEVAHELVLKKYAVSRLSVYAPEVCQELGFHRSFIQFWTMMGW